MPLSNHPIYKKGHVPLHPGRPKNVVANQPVSLAAATRTLGVTKGFGLMPIPRPRAMATRQMRSNDLENVSSDQVIRITICSKNFS